MNGIFLLYANGIFNLNSTAGMKFNWFYFEPYVFLGIIAADNMKLLTN